ncbi:MAG TPA: cation diffusion facilitator family transporter [Caulobacteraceae bacterium]|nr:cation diffusion facilitator family transporter [Caulobacteraceae bacterium]
MPDGSTRVVYVALAGNLAIAATKLGAFALTRSSAMLTEAVHSLVDTLDQVFLLVGIRRAARPPDEAHPFGHGLEAYFWSFVVALMIFTVGGAASVYAGVRRIMAPEMLVHPWVNYIVLAASAGFEGVSFAVSWREYKRFVHDRSVRVWSFLRLSKDPALFSTLLEDGAALLGLAIAALGVTGSAYLGLAWADGAASVAIGLLLTAVALFLANEVRSLIAGEAAAPRVLAEVRRILEADPHVARLEEVLTLQLGPNAILVAVTLDFHDALTAGEVLSATAGLSDAIQASDQRIGRIFLRPANRRDRG